MKVSVRVAVFFVAITGLSAACHAEVRCLWLNVATASGFLGGDVEAAISPLSPPGDEACEFHHKQGFASSMLRIVVHTMDSPPNEFASYLAQCDGTKAPLKGIGNEAVQCLNKNGLIGEEERIIGRVRERAFIITVSRPESANHTALIGLRDDTRNIAEQVAGNLF
jgi:hypothetical protein